MRHKKADGFKISVLFSTIIIAFSLTVLSPEHSKGLNRRDSNIDSLVVCENKIALENGVYSSYYKVGGWDDFIFNFNFAVRNTNFKETEYSMCDKAAFNENALFIPSDIPVEYIYFEAAPPRSPESDDKLFRILAGEKLSERIKAGEELLLRHPENERTSEILSVLADAYNYSGDYLEARITYDKLISRNPAKDVLFTTYERLSDMFANKMSDFDSAIEYGLRALDLFSSDSSLDMDPFHKHLSTSYYFMGDLYNCYKHTIQVKKPDKNDFYSYKTETENAMSRRKRLFAANLYFIEPEEQGKWLDMLIAMDSAAAEKQLSDLLLDENNLNRSLFLEKLEVLTGMRPADYFMKKMKASSGYEKAKCLRLLWQILKADSGKPPSGDSPVNEEKDTGLNPDNPAFKVLLSELYMDEKPLVSSEAKNALNKLYGCHPPEIKSVEPVKFLKLSFNKTPAPPRKDLKPAVEKLIERIREQRESGLFVVGNSLIEGMPAILNDAAALGPDAFPLLYDEVKKYLPACETEYGDVYETDFALLVVAMARTGNEAVIPILNDMRNCSNYYVSSSVYAELIRIGEPAIPYFEKDLTKRNVNRRFHFGGFGHVIDASVALMSIQGMEAVNQGALLLKYMKPEDKESRTPIIDKIEKTTGLDFDVFRPSNNPDKFANLEERMRRLALWYDRFYYRPPIWESATNGDPEIRFVEKNGEDLEFVCEMKNPAGEKTMPAGENGVTFFYDKYQEGISYDYDFLDTILEYRGGGYIWISGYKNFFRINPETGTISDITDLFGDCEIGEIFTEDRKIEDPFDPGVFWYLSDKHNSLVKIDLAGGKATLRMLKNLRELKKERGEGKSTLDILPGKECLWIWAYGKIFCADKNTLELSERPLKFINGTPVSYQKKLWREEGNRIFLYDDCDSYSCDSNSIYFTDSGEIVDTDRIVKDFMHVQFLGKDRLVYTDEYWEPKPGETYGNYIYSLDLELLARTMPLDGVPYLARDGIPWYSKDYLTRCDPATLEPVFRIRLECCFQIMDDDEEYLYLMSKQGVLRARKDGAGVDIYEGVENPKSVRVSDKWIWLMSDIRLVRLDKSMDDSLFTPYETYGIAREKEISLEKLLFDARIGGFDHAVEVTKLYRDMLLASGSEISWKTMQPPLEVLESYSEKSASPEERLNRIVDFLSLQEEIGLIVKDSYLEYSLSAYGLPKSQIEKIALERLDKLDISKIQTRNVLYERLVRLALDSGDFLGAYDCYQRMKKDGVNYRFLYSIEENGDQEVFRKFADAFKEINLLNIPEDEKLWERAEILSNYENGCYSWGYDEGGGSECVRDGMEVKWELIDRYPESPWADDAYFDYYFVHHCGDSMYCYSIKEIIGIFSTFIGKYPDSPFLPEAMDAVSNTIHNYYDEEGIDNPETEKKKLEEAESFFESLLKKYPASSIAKRFQEEIENIRRELTGE